MLHFWLELQDCEFKSKNGGSNGKVLSKWRPPPSCISKNWCRSIIYLPFPPNFVGMWRLWITTHIWYRKRLIIRIQDGGCNHHEFRNIGSAKGPNISRFFGSAKGRRTVHGSTCWTKNRAYLLDVDPARNIPKMEFYLHYVQYVLLPTKYKLT